MRPILYPVMRNACFIRLTHNWSEINTLLHYVWDDDAKM